MDTNTGTQPAIGIDLGTTNSLAAAWVNGETILIPNALGDVMTPSAVSEMDDGSLLVGLAARERLCTHPARTAAAFKRWMGTAQTQALASHCLRAEMLSAQVLGALRADAQAHFGCPVAQAVITVPAYFNTDQRHATKVAAQLAGFERIHLLNEPTAAGLAYGLQTRQELSTFLVFDLGGGTFDVSMLEYFEGVVQVRSSAGDTRLGGEDFVQALATLARTRAGLGDAGGPVPDSSWRSFEAAKRELSACDGVDVVPAAGHPAVHLARSDYEQACAPLLQRLRAPMERALRDARLMPDELDEVVLVGGATRMPMIRHMLAQLFQKLPLRTINPDETVARGAAVYAGMLARDEALEDVVLTDVMPYSLGIITGSDQASDIFTPIIERNTPVPVSIESVFGPRSSAQPEVQLDVRQGESPYGSENLCIGQITVPLDKAGAQRRDFTVRFSYDISGLLEVDVTQLATGRALNHVFQLGSNQLDEKEVERIRASLARIRHTPRHSEESVHLLAWGRRFYEEGLGQPRAMVGEAVMQLEHALAQYDLRATAQAQARLRSLLEVLDQGFRL
jgi:molecular chaperone HscC